MKKSFNLSRFDFVTLRLFCAVAHSGSITQGAQTCHLALSAASRRLSEFEAATGTPLLERSKKGVLLTPAGHLTLQHCLRLFQGLEQFHSALSDYDQGLRGHVRLWANMSSLTEYLPRILHDFLSEHSDIVVELEEQLSGDIARALVDGIADIGVLADETPMDGLTVLPFQTNELVLLCHASHPLAKLKKVDFNTCLQYDFVGLNRGSSLLELTSRTAEISSFSTTSTPMPRASGLAATRMALTRLRPASVESAVAGRWLPTITTGMGTCSVRLRK